MDNLWKFSESKSTYEQTRGTIATYKPLTLDWTIGFNSNKLIIKIINTTINGNGQGWLTLGGEQFQRYRSIGYFHSVNNSDKLPIISEKADGLTSLNKIFISNGGSAHIQATFIFIGC